MARCAVRDGEAWWVWDARAGARSNQGDLTPERRVGEEVPLMLDPSPVRGVLRFMPTRSPRMAHNSGVDLA